MRALLLVVSLVTSSTACESTAAPDGGAPLDAPRLDDAGASDTASLDAPGIDAPPASVSLVFANDWPTVGSTSEAVRGTTGATPWELRIGRDALSVVAAAAEGIDDGCPTPNVLRTDLNYVGGDVQNMSTDAVSMLPGSGAWPIPAVGTSVYYRVYARFVYPSAADPGTLGNNNHPLENQSGGVTNWSWTFHTAPEGVLPHFQVWVGGAPTRFALGGPTPVYLARDTWYRIEMRLTRTADDAREHEIRIYDAAGVLLHDDGDFFDTASPTVPLTGFSEGFSDLDGLDGWQLGTNGPHVVGATRGAEPAWYWAAAAVSTTDWCGVYVAGESP